MLDDCIQATLEPNCPNCGANSWDWTNWVDEETQLHIFRCNKCDHLFIEKTYFVDVTFRNDIGKILMGIDVEASLERIKKIYEPLDEGLKKLERGE